MDEHLNATNLAHAETAVRNLRSNGFEAELLENREAVLAYLKKKIPEGASVGVGGSMTLFETGIIAWLEQAPGLTYYDRYHTDDVDAVFHQCLNADVYLMSANAVTMDGHLYNVDGNGNRVAALTFGPKKVYVIAGVNKLVPDLQAAIQRNELFAAPANNDRLNTGNPCTNLGKCIHCSRDTTICNDFVFTRRCRPQGRIHVLLVNEELGY